MASLQQMESPNNHPVGVDGYSAAEPTDFEMGQQEAIDRLLRLRERFRQRASDGHAKGRIAQVLELAEESDLDCDWAPYEAARIDASYALDFEAMTIAVLTLLRQKAGQS